jgi:hypothetical protein
MTPSTTKPKRNRLGERLRAQGFDLTTYDRAERAYYPRCSCCQVVVINGTACHEIGCGNQKGSS